MPALSKDQLRQELKRGELRPVYLLYGPETFLRDGALRYIAQQAFGEGDFQDLNDTTFSLTTDADVLRQAIAAAEQLPMMASRRLVRITDLRISQTGFRDTVTEETDALLRTYLESPSPTSVVVFVADELNANRKMGKLLKEKAAAVEFGKLDDAELVKWASREFQRLGASISAHLANELVLRAGDDLHRLNNEINKLAAAALPTGVVSEELLAQLVPASRELDNFSFTGHLVGGRPGQAFLTLKKLLDDGTEPLALIGILAFTFRRLLIAKDMMERGADRAQVVSSLRMRYSDQEAFLAAARRSRMGDLVEAVRGIAAADLAIKTSIGGSASGARMQIEMLVARLAILTAR